MASRIFLDTNILFDVIDIKRPNSKNVKSMFSIFKKRDFRLFISAVTINNIVYVMQNKFKVGNKYLKTKIKILLELIEIVPYDMEVLLDGLRLSFDDIEDAFQYVSALKCKSDYLITEDKKFIKEVPKKSRLKVVNTIDFINILNEY